MLSLEGRFMLSDGLALIDHLVITGMIACTFSSVSLCIVELYFGQRVGYRESAHPLLF